MSCCLYFSVLWVRGRSWVAKANLDPCVRAIPLAAVPRRFPARGDPATHLYVMLSSKCHFLIAPHMRFNGAVGGVHWAAEPAVLETPCKLLSGTAVGSASLDSLDPIDVSCAS